MFCINTTHFTLISQDNQGTLSNVMLSQPKQKCTMEEEKKQPNKKKKSFLRDSLSFFFHPVGSYCFNF